MREPGSARTGALLVACALACDVACAQPALQSSAAASAAERAQKESDRTMYWIRVLATTPAPVKAPPKPAAAPALPAEAREKPRAAAAPATPTATGSNAAPAPKAVAHVPTPAQAAVGNASEPSALSSRSADNVASTRALPPLEVTPSPPPEPDPGLVQIKSVQPEFPVSVVERIRKGHVEVRFEVEPGGTVVDATVVGTSSPRLNGSALDAVKQWRFKPTSASHTAAVDLVFNIDKSN